MQDLSIVIDSIKDLPQGIEAMPHNFFTGQPVKDAAAYYLRAVLHDWPDKQAHEILANIRVAMGPSSLLLVNKNALPDTHVPLFAAQADMTMMACVSALERTQKQFKTLLEDAGFELIRVWTPQEAGLGAGSIFEAVKK